MNAVEAARSLVGEPTAPSGTGMAGYDCIGLVCAVGRITGLFELDIRVVDPLAEGYDVVRKLTEVLGPPVWELGNGFVPILAPGMVIGGGARGGRPMHCGIVTWWRDQKNVPGIVQAVPLSRGRQVGTGARSGGKVSERPLNIKDMARMHFAWTT